MPTLLDALCDRLGTSLDVHGRAHADCPFCGAAPVTARGRGRSYHFYLYDSHFGRGAVCWACGWRGALADLARELDVIGTDTAPARPRPEVPAAPWQARGALAQYRQAAATRADLLARWQAYKPVSAATVARFDLGLGRVPLYDERRRRWYGYGYERLILPLLAGGQLVGFTGRAIDPQDDGPKWLTASFSDLSHLFGIELVDPGATVIVCENRIDAVLAMQVEPSATVVAIGGAHWRPDWTQQLAARRPRRALIWLDHDLAGNGSRYHERELLEEWRAKVAARRAARPELAARPWPQAPEPRGPRIANDLLAAGIAASLYTWPRGTPLHQDLGAAVITDTAARSAA